MPTPTAQMIAQLNAILAQWKDLLDALPPDSLKLHLGDLRSNAIGDQLWCLGGCRESNLASLKADAPFSWTCTYAGSAQDKPPLAAYLLTQAEGLESFLEDHPTLSETQTTLLLDLLAHEFQHQGQMIRFLYANALPIPKSWQSFWHLEP